MAKEGIFKQLKEVIYCLYDSNGNKRVKEIGLVADRNLSDSRLELLRNICELVLDTDLLKEETKIYLSDRNIKYNQVNEIINERIKKNNELVKINGKNGGTYGIGVEVSQSNTTSKIQYDRLKLESLLGSDIITHTLLMTTVSIESYQIKVGNLLAKYKGVESLRGKLGINIKDDIYRRDYNGDFIKDFGEIIHTYMLDTIKKVEEEFNSNEDAVGYFNFLLSNVTPHNEKVREDREKLRKLLTGIEQPIKKEKKIGEDRDKSVKKDQYLEENNEKAVEENKDAVENERSSSEEKENLLDFDFEDEDGDVINLDNDNENYQENDIDSEEVEDDSEESNIGIDKEVEEYGSLNDIIEEESVIIEKNNEIIEEESKKNEEKVDMPVIKTNRLQF